MPPDDPIFRRYGAFQYPIPPMVSAADWLAVLDGVIITRAEHDYGMMRMNYVGYHPDFDAIVRGTEAPLYKPVVTGGKRIWERVQPPPF
jgi:hypothetical protein